MRTDFVKVEIRRIPRAFHGALIFGFCLLSACQPSIIPAPRPTPSFITVESTAALQSLEQQINQCTEELENTGLVLLNRPASALDLNQTALALRWGAIRPDGSEIRTYAAVIGEEELAIVVHPQNMIQHISADDLEAIYTGRMRNWKTGSAASEIQVLVYPKGEEAQEIFEQTFLNRSTVLAQITSLVPDPAAMRETIAKNPGAIGFLPRRWVDSTVKTLPVEGLDPAQLRHPILALSQSEPTGQAKEWLVCLQEKMRE